jgi:hypothetical protein
MGQRSYPLSCHEIRPAPNPGRSRFELNPLQKVGRLLWKATRDLFFPSPVTKDLLDRSLLSPDLGIERQKSSQIIGRQVSWSWNQTILTEVAAKQTNPAAASRQKPDRQLSRQLSGLHAEHSPKGGQKQGSVKRAFSRTGRQEARGRGTEERGGEKVSRRVGGGS